MEKFRIIAITPPLFFPEEVSRITEILDSGEADFVHIRKPDSTSREITELITQLPQRLHYRLKIHDHFQLLEEFSLAGVHLNSRNPKAPLKNISISKSLHSLEELSVAHEFDYATLSPIFDSISKKGYRAKFDYQELREHLKGKENIIALGGVTPEKFPLLRSLGFSGAALLSHFFHPQYPILNTQYPNP